MYLFIDPGESTGWARFDEEGKAIEAGQIKGFDNLCAWLSTDAIPFHTELVGIEQFVLYPWKAQAQMWSQFWTVQVIGAIKFRAYSCQVKVEMLRSADYPMGFRYQGQEVPPHSNPLHDQLVAHAHGVFWLQKHGIRKPQQGR